MLYERLAVVAGCHAVDEALLVLLKDVLRWNGDRFGAWVPVFWGTGTRDIVSRRAGGSRINGDVTWLYGLGCLQPAQKGLHQLLLLLLLLLLECGTLNLLLVELYHPPRCAAWGGRDPCHPHIGIMPISA